MDRFLVGIIGMPLAFFLIFYRKQIKDFVGDIAFAEKFFGMGGTYNFLVVLGVVFFIGSLMYALGTLQAILWATLGPFFGNNPAL